MNEGDCTKELSKGEREALQTQTLRVYRLSTLVYVCAVRVHNFTFSLPAEPAIPFKLGNRHLRVLSVLSEIFAISWLVVIRL